MKEFYQECLLYEECTLAHYICHLLSEQKISLQDDLSKLDLNKANHQKVAEMIQKNVLGIRRVNVYSLKRNKQYFIFIFARSEQEAIEYYVKTYHETPKNCHEYPLEFEIARGNETLTFRDLKKEYKSFPAVAGFYKKEWPGHLNR